MNRDQKFFDMYSLVIGALAIFALLILVGSMMLSELTQGVYTSDAEEYQAAVESRIRPLGQVYMPGEESAAGEPQVAAAAKPEPVATTMSGPQVYNSACLVCHGAGVGGAPVVGNAEAWGPRVAQGIDVLYEHALGGYSGQTGYMPPKGARMDLSDEDVKAAVDYMVSEASK